MRRDLVLRAAAFEPILWWENRKPCLEEIAARNMASRNDVHQTVLYNPYAGQASARQLEETVEEFLKRLPALTTCALDHDWIFIANPFRQNLQLSEDRWAAFVKEGINLLRRFGESRAAIRKQKEGQSKASITKAVNVEKQKVVDELLRKATEMQCVTGKVRPSLQVKPGSSLHSIADRAKVPELLSSERATA